MSALPEITIDDALARFLDAQLLLRAAGTVTKSLAKALHQQ